MIEYINHIMQSDRSENTNEACKVALQFIKANPSIQKVFTDDKDALLIISVIKYLTQNTPKNQAHG
jgi:hypothetical protein